MPDDRRALVVQLRPFPIRLESLNSGKFSDYTSLIIKNFLPDRFNRVSVPGDLAAVSKHSSLIKICGLVTFRF